MNDANGDLVWLAAGRLLFLIDDCAFNGFGKARIHLHRGKDHKRIAGHEEHAGRRHLASAVNAIKDAVAEDAMTVQVISDRQIE